MLAREALHAGKFVDPVAKVRHLIRRKTSERDRLLKEIAGCEAALLPLQEHQRTMEALDREIHELFRGLLANPKLSKRAQKQVRELYEALQDDQALSLDPTRAAERASSCCCPACSSSADDPSAWAEELFGADGTETPRAEPDSHPPRRPERDASVRALYHKLAFRFHPDRAEDDARRAEHETVMREVNDAYHGGDTERLLMLSRELGIEIGELKAGDGLLAELVRQYERIKAEVRAIRSSPLGTLIADVRRSRQHNYRSPIEVLEEQAKTALEHLADMRDFVQDFAQGRMSLKAFLSGPQGESAFEADEAEDLFLEFIGMVEQLQRASRGSTKSARGRSTASNSARQRRNR
jgi:hypothetical protein